MAEHTPPELQGEPVGDLIYRLFEEHVFTETKTDLVAEWAGRVVSTAVPWVGPVAGRVVRWRLDARLPQFGLWALRELMQVVGLLRDSDRHYHPENPFRR